MTTSWTKPKAESHINDLFINTLGRPAVFGSNFTDGSLDSLADADYWTEQLMSGKLKGDGDLAASLLGGSEFKNRDKFIRDYRAANDGANPEEALIDANIGPGGVRYATADNPTVNLKDQWADNNWLKNFGIGDNFAVQSSDPLYDAKSSALAISNQAGTVPGTLITASTSDPVPPAVDDPGIKTVVDGPLPPAPKPQVIYQNSPYEGPSLQDFEDMLKKMFSNPWTPYGYGWGGSNTKGAKMNRSLASRGGSTYKGMSSSFGRSGDRLSNLTGPAINI